MSSVLIMKGGGIKGLAYVGALEILDPYFDFNWYVGTSAGAVSAVLLASGYRTEELKEILLAKNFGDFKDAGFLKKIYNLFTKQGLYEAETFRSWLNDLIVTKLESPTIVALQDLPQRVTIYATRKYKEALVFYSQDPETKTMDAVYAARCSMAIPFVFTPEKHMGLNVFDGGAQNNYPARIFRQGNPNLDFIGLYLGPEHYQRPKKTNIFKELLSIWTETVDYTALEKYRDKTVIIDTGPISTLQFSLNPEEKEFLLESGRLAAKKFLIKKGLLDENLENELKEHFENRSVLEKRISKKKSLKKAIVVILTLSIVTILSFNLLFFSTEYLDGTIMDNNGDGIEDVTVSVKGIIDSSIKEALAPTNEDGNFRIYVNGVMSKYSTFHIVKDEIEINQSILSTEKNKNNVYKITLNQN